MLFSSQKLDFATRRATSSSRLLSGAERQAHKPNRFLLRDDKALHNQSLQKERSTRAVQEDHQTVCLFLVAFPEERIVALSIDRHVLQPEDFLQLEISGSALVPALHLQL